MQSDHTVYIRMKEPKETDFTTDIPDISETESNTTERDAHAQLSARLLENLSTAILLINAELLIVYLNPTAQSLLATSEARLNNLPIEEIFRNDKPSIEDLHKALNNGHTYTKREATLSVPGKEPATVDYTVTPIQFSASDPDYRPHATQGRHLIIEIQELDRLLRISRDESQFSTHQATLSLVKGVAHEIKNPLGGIRGAAQLLGRELQELSDANNNDLQDYIDVIIGETDRLRNLVDQMLGPNQLPNMGSVNIHYVLERVKQIIDAESQGQVTVYRDYDTSLPEIYADADQLIQACLNITRNALEALLEAPQKTDSPHSEETPQKKSITLRTRVDYHLTIGTVHHRLILCIGIIDNGPGISEHIKETLFYPMVSGRAHGTGLGLSIAQSLIRRHHGLIECDSKPGQTAFNIYLPMEQPHDST